MSSTEATSPSDDLFTETMHDCGCPKLKYLIRPLSRRSFTFSCDDYTQKIQKQINEETKEGLDSLYARYRQEKRKPSGSETHAVRVAVSDKYERMMLTYRLEMELWAQSERTLSILRVKGLYPEQQVRPSTQVLADFIRAC